MGNSELTEEQVLDQAYDEAGEPDVYVDDEEGW